ncbi:MAG TPA: SPASM domain-containing protein [Candidatus Nanoarchaeia archaeon]|nr:SPASM domain-containing protein [Candidatus Nanoarchaeia archaeon]
MSKQTLEQKIPVTFAGKIQIGWTNGVKDWHINDATPGLYTLDIEHIADELVDQHNDADSQESVASRYRADLCLHKCPACFNEQSIVYSKVKRDLNGKLIKAEAENYSLNRMMTLEDTLNVVDQAIRIAWEEGHDFKSVKFLGPGELLMNSQLFEIVGEYEKRRIQLNIFTKGALLGSDELAQKYHGMTAKQLVEKLASYSNVGLLMSFQSFDDKLQDSLVTSRDETGTVTGLQEYSKIREQAIENLFSSRFYNSGMTNRICIINAPIIPENIGESFDIYKFFVERGTPVVMTPSMLSGKGCGQYAKQEQTISVKEWHNQLVELYAKIYAYNVSTGVQTPEQVRSEGIASYVGAEPCNQAATGLYIRANGIVQMCPGRFDRETVYANVQDTPLSQIWENSPNRRMGIENPQNLVNNRCPAKDGFAFPKDFYERVMQRFLELTK